MTPHPQIVSLQSVSYAYPNRGEEAIHGVDLELGAGELTLVAGRSGSGKSTVGWCINGLIPHFFGGEAGGVATVCGKRVAEHPVWELSRHVGSVFQNARSQLFATTVEEEAALGPQNLGVPRDQIEERVSWALESVGMDHLRPAPLTELSDGQQQRVAIASALALGGDALLLDEPTANLDPGTGKRLLNILADLGQRQGTAVLLIEHRTSPALDFADTLVAMDAGEIRGRCAAQDLTPHTFPEPMGMRCTRPPSIDEILAKQQPANGPAVAEAEGLCFSYGNGFALQDISCEVREAECVALVGDNGSGKTTLIKQLAGLLKPSHGDARVAGLDIRRTRVSAIGRRVGLVLQNTDHQLFMSTVFDEVALPLKLAGERQSEVEPQVSRTLDLLGLSHLADRHPHSLSGGEKQRVTIAAAIVRRPRLLMLDEPTSGMDAYHMGLLVQLLKDLQCEEGMALLVASHDMELVGRLANRVYVMDGGGIAPAC